MKILNISLMMSFLLLSNMAFALPPQIFIYSPENITYNSNNIYFNFTQIDDNSTDIYLKLYVNGNLVDNYTAGNDTWFSGYNEFPPLNASYNFTIWAEDSDNETNSSEVFFSIIYSEPISLNNNYSYVICIDSMTLLKHTAILNGMAYNYSSENISCSFGCNNMTMSCNPSEIEQNLIYLGIFILIIIGILLFDRFILK